MLMRFADVDRKVETVAELDVILDSLTIEGQPVLVELRSGADALSLGVGLEDAAVALFLDADGRPWCARSRQGSPAEPDEDLAFAKNGTMFRFYAHAAVRPSLMREAAREFVRLPNARPTVVDWLPEGLDTSAGGEHGP